MEQPRAVLGQRRERHACQHRRGKRREPSLERPAQHNKGTVAHLVPGRGHCSAFSSTIPPLQVALSFACSVASLSHSPSLQLPGGHGLHHGHLADYLLGWGSTSTCTAGHTELQRTPITKAPKGYRNTSTPKRHIQKKCAFTSNKQTAKCVCRESNPHCQKWRPALPHQPNLYLEPKWLRYLIELELNVEDC